MSLPRSIELLAPARTADIGCEAILHGADAVYIGAPAYGARAAAGNSVEDIARLVSFAHLYNAKVYVTLNTILYDDELPDVKRLVGRLYEAGVDALIVQDMAFLKMDLPPIELHASTQMDITTPERAAFLEKAGLSQLVLARELGLDQIKEIRKHTSVPLEAFIHGALCVSYSGRCYASQICMLRSANRGECAQFCRLAFDLIDANGKALEKSKHLLSLKDMNRSKSLEQMLDAGISSFKIEGRLKDVAYVKNVTAYYSQRLDEIVAKRPNDFKRSSDGHSEASFSPNPEKSFNRGFTEYFLHGRSPVHQFLTPKSLGEKLGRVTHISKNSFTSDSPVQLTAGDGLCFFDSDGKLNGIRVNKVEGNKIYPLKMSGIFVGAEIWRNHDHALTTLLQAPTAQRYIEANITLSQTSNGYQLRLCDETGVSTTASFKAEIKTANKPQKDNISRILTKTGGTPLKITHIDIQTQAEPFIPSSTLTQWRRHIVEQHLAARSSKLNSIPTLSSGRGQLSSDAEARSLAPQAFPNADHRLNVSNRLAESFFSDLGLQVSEPAVELQHKAQTDTRKPFAIMTCKHCILYALGHCKKDKSLRLAEPLSLLLPNGKTFPLAFDCQKCEMQIFGS